MALAAEVYILRDRTQALEELLTRVGVMNRGALEEIKVNAERSSAERDAFIARVLGRWFPVALVCRETALPLEPKKPVRIGYRSAKREGVVRRPLSVPEQNFFWHLLPSNDQLFI